MQVKFYKIIKIENKHPFPPTSPSTSITRFKNSCSTTNVRMYVYMPHGKIFFFDKKNSNDVAKNTLLIFYLHDRKHFKKESSMLTCSCAHGHMFTS